MRHFPNVNEIFFETSCDLTRKKYKTITLSFALNIRNTQEKKEVMQYCDLIIYENVMWKGFILSLHLTVNVPGLWDSMVGVKRLLKELKNFYSTVNRQWENIFIDDLLI